MLQQMVAMPDRKKICDIRDSATPGQEKIADDNQPAHVPISLNCDATIPAATCNAELSLAVARKEYLVALRLPELTLRERIRKASALRRASRRIEACDLTLALLRHQAQTAK